MSYVPSPDHAYESILYIDADAVRRRWCGPSTTGPPACSCCSSGCTSCASSSGAPTATRASWRGSAARSCSSWSWASASPGYLLPWDQKAYWATVVGTNIAGSAPIIGGRRAGAAAGRPAAGRGDADALLRHPHLGAAGDAGPRCVAFHLFGVIRQGIAASPRRKPLVEPQPGETRRETYEREYAAEKEAGKPFWEALFKDAIVALVVVVAGRDRGRPGRARRWRAQADPNATNYAPRPEWYFLDLFQLLWYFGGSFEPLIIFGLFTLGVLIFLLVPFLDRGRARHPRQRPVAMGLAAIVVIGVLWLTVVGLLGRRRASPGPAARGHDDHPAERPGGLQHPGLRRLPHRSMASAARAGPACRRPASAGTAAPSATQIVTPKDASMPAYDKLSQRAAGRPRRVPDQPPVGRGVAPRWKGAGEAEAPREGLASPCDGRAGRGRRQGDGKGRGPAATDNGYRRWAAGPNGPEHPAAIPWTTPV